MFIARAHICGPGDQVEANLQIDINPEGEDKKLGRHLCLRYHPCSLEVDVFY